MSSMIAPTEFWKKVNIGPAIKVYAEKYSDFNHLWEDCDRADFMLWLLQRLEYKNANKLWKVYKEIRVTSKRKLPDKQLTNFTQDIDSFFNNYKKDLRDSITKQHETIESVKENYLSNAFLYIELALREAIEDEVFSAKFNAGAEARFKKVNIVTSEDGKIISKNVLTEADEKEINEIRKKTAEKTQLELFKKYAEVFRQVIGNPFLPKNQIDFEYIPDFD